MTRRHLDGGRPVHRPAGFESAPLPTPPGAGSVVPNCWPRRAWRLGARNTEVVPVGQSNELARWRSGGLRFEDDGGLSRPHDHDLLRAARRADRAPVGQPERGAKTPGCKSASTPSDRLMRPSAGACAISSTGAISLMDVSA